MRQVFIFQTLLVALIATVWLPCAHADPCGLVPPVFVGPEIPIERIGVQKTYVFYKSGIETMVLRPGFSGRVDEFGMLIPFPSPPAIRKMPDNIFEQVTAAIDPPEVVVDLRPRGGFGGFGGGGGLGGGGGGLGFRVPEDEVRVVREEAVGMYEVAVLEAGSARALKRWIDHHKYTYPSGMDEVCPEYVDMGWCFVAVKTKVKQKNAAEPQPGQNKIDNNLPEGSAFDGHVQAMGFRFPTRELVVPMRLSAYNPGDLRNVVYVLTDKTVRINRLPEDFVVRQISGGELLSNLTNPLPLRVIGGRATDISAAERRRLRGERDPKPKNGVAAELFASDLLAATTQRLMSSHERMEKELQNISEELNLRGADIDKQVSEAFHTERNRVTRTTLRGLDSMVFTVIDGDFPRRVIAEENLTFAEYAMPRSRSKREFYDANQLGPAPKKEGILILGMLESPSETLISKQHGRSSERDADASLNSGQFSYVFYWVSALAVGLLLAKRCKGTSRHLLLLIALALLCISLGVTATANDRTPTLPVLISRLNDLEQSRRTAKLIVELGEDAVPALITQSNKKELPIRGRAIVCLGKIGGPNATAHLKSLSQNQKQPQLVRTWAAAAMVRAARTEGELLEVASLVSSNPALGRPLAIEFQRRLAEEEQSPLEGMLIIAEKVSSLERALAADILAAGSKNLVNVMLTAEDQAVRRKAAAYLATIGTKDGNESTVAADVATALKFDPDMKQTPWHDGPLFLPSIKWPAEESRQLYGRLIAWHLWCERNNELEIRRQINNNLRSVGLTRAVGAVAASGLGPESKAWLKTWKNVVGRDEVVRMLEQQNALSDYSDVLGE